MNEEKKVPFKWEYGEETISLQLGMYANNQRLYRRVLYAGCGTCGAGIQCLLYLL